MPREFTDAEASAFSRYQVYGTPEEVAKIISANAELKTENAERRKENKALTEERDAAKALVPEGAKVLTGEEAKAYETLTTKGVKLAEVEKIAQERDTLRTEKAAREKRDALGKAVATEGWVQESAALLHKLLDASGLDFEVKDEDVDATENGKAVKKKAPVGYVTVDGKPVRLSKWAEGEELPASVFTATRGNGTEGRSAPDQRGGGGNPADAKSKDGVEAAVQANHAAAMAPNPLTPHRVKTTA